MFDPLQLYLGADCKPNQHADDLLDEEHYAQRFGNILGPSLSSRFSLWLGRRLIRIGEKLTGECHTVKLSRETA